MARNLLDLHGLRGDEVWDRVEKFIASAEKAGLKQVRIMTGKGKGIVKAKTLEWLKLAHYHFKQDGANEGVLVVFL